MSLASKLQALVDGLEDTREEIEGKGAILPPGSPLGDYPGAVESIESGGGDPWVPMPGPGQLTSTTSMFRYGWSQFLTSVELFDTSNVTTMSSMFNGCSSLVEVPLFDTSNATVMSYMFDGCSSLVEVPLFDTSSVTNMTFMFRRCSSLVEVELTDCSKVTNTSDMFGSHIGSTQATSLERLILPGMTRGFSLRNTNMGASALNDFFDSLGTASGSQIINITGAPGAAACDKSIATAKGWTITG